MAGGVLETVSGSHPGEKFTELAAHYDVAQ